ALEQASCANATGLFEWCPTALVLGIWDSTGARGGLGTKIPRSLVSEIVGIDVEPGVRTSSRIDPLQIQKEAGILYELAEGGWTLDSEKAKIKKSESKNQPVKLGKEGKPSEANHGNVTPTLSQNAGGVTLTRARQVTTVSLCGLRRLRFPVDGKYDVERDRAGWAALAALALCGTMLARRDGYNLRSRCQLVPVGSPSWEILSLGGSAIAYDLPQESAITLLNEAVAEARKVSLRWKEQELVLTPFPDVVKLVRNSRSPGATTGAAEAK
ncbi:MAG: type I-U CRISPR-associated protein Cas7, partial [Pseudomonadota bacterium]